MPITFTKDAANIIFNIMEKQGLDKNLFGVNFTLQEENIGFDFTRNLTDDHKSQYGINLYVDPAIEEDIIVSAYKSSDGRNGLLFLGKNEFKGEL